MNVKELKEALEQAKPETEIVIDMDDNGWYTLENVFLKRSEFGGYVINLQSSNSQEHRDKLEE